MADKKGREARREEREQEEREDLAADFGWSLQFLKSHPALEEVFNQAVKGNWSPNRFIAELRDTKWFQKNSESMRQYIVNRATDPASWQQDVDRLTAHVQDVYGSLYGSKLSGKQADRWAKQAMMFAWTDEQIKDHIVGGINARKQWRSKDLGGQAAQVKDQINQLRSAYGVRVSNKWAANQMDRVLNGNDTIDGAANYLRELAKSKYTAFADELDSGKTMSDIADPYVQSVAQLLEMNPQQLDLNNNLIQKALTRRLDGKPDPMSMSQFEDFVRKDPRWMKTDQANEQFASAAHGLAEQWGLI